MGSGCGAKGWWGSQDVHKKSSLWPGKAVREELDPSLNRKWVFGVLVSSGLLVQGHKYLAPWMLMDIQLLMC